MSAQLDTLMARTYTGLKLGTVPLRPENPEVEPKWFKRASTHDRNGDLDEALAVLFSHVQRSIENGSISHLENDLRQIELMGCSANLLSALLTATHPLSHTLPSYTDFYTHIRTLFLLRGDDLNLLVGLAD